MTEMKLTKTNPTMMNFTYSQPSQNFQFPHDCNRAVHTCKEVSINS